MNEFNSLKLSNVLCTGHNQILKSIRNMENRGVIEKDIDYSVSSYKTKRNATYPMYILTEKFFNDFSSKSKYSLNYGNITEKKYIKFIKDYFVEFKDEYLEQYKIGKYYVDLIHKEYKLIIEIDEKHHKQTKKEDDERIEEIQKIIKEKTTSYEAYEFVHGKDSKGLEFGDKGSIEEFGAIDGHDGWKEWTVIRIKEGELAKGVREMNGFYFDATLGDFC